MLSLLLLLYSAETPQTDGNLPIGQPAATGKPQTQTSQKDGALTDVIPLPRAEYDNLIRQANLANLGKSIQSERDKLRDDNTKISAQLAQMQEEMNKLRQPQKRKIDEFVEKTLPKHSLKKTEENSFFEEDEETTVVPITKDLLLSFGEALLDTVDDRVKEHIGKTSSEIKSEIQQQQQVKETYQSRRQAIDETMNKRVKQLQQAYSITEEMADQYTRLLEDIIAKRDAVTDIPDVAERASAYAELVDLEDKALVMRDDMRTHKAKVEADVKRRTTLVESTASPVVYGQIEQPELLNGETLEQRNLRAALAAMKKAETYGVYKPSVA